MTFRARTVLTAALVLLLGACAAPPLANDSPRRQTDQSDQSGQTSQQDRPAAARAPVLPPTADGRTAVFSRGPRTQPRQPAQTQKLVALTFDADMTAGQGQRAEAGERFDNPALIAALRELRVPATVFMTGMWARTYPSQARSIGEDQLFEVGNHSDSHHAFTDDCYGLPTLPRSRHRAEVTEATAALRSAGVRQVPYFRFPGGCYDDQALRAIEPTGVTAVQWDVVSGDPFNEDADAITREVVREVRPGSVVVMHCTLSAAPATEAAVRQIVPELRKRGYRFVRVSEMIDSAQSESQEHLRGPLR